MRLLQRSLEAHGCTRMEKGETVNDRDADAAKGTCASQS